MRTAPRRPNARIVGTIENAFVLQVSFSQLGHMDSRFIVVVVCSFAIGTAFGLPGSSPAGVLDEWDSVLQSSDSKRSFLGEQITAALQASTTWRWTRPAPQTERPLEPPVYSVILRRSILCFYAQKS